MWRWSYFSRLKSNVFSVFSTCVEVILISGTETADFSSILHVCGGDPKWKPSGSFTILYSPRVWRWSYGFAEPDIKTIVFSTCVEVIPSLSTSSINSWSILHVCGGDPTFCLKINTFLKYSPRVWRWSRWWNSYWISSCVFSTCVEVILISSLFQQETYSILHVCGGDPHTEPEFGNNYMYSPRVWRWSL